MESIIGIIVLVFVVISRISKAMEEQAKKNLPAPQRQEQKPKVQRHLQDEIEKFLREVQKKTGQTDWNQPETSSQSQFETGTSASASQRGSSESEIRPAKGKSKRDRREAARQRKETERLTHISAEKNRRPPVKDTRLEPFSAASSLEGNVSAVIQPGSGAISSRKEGQGQSKIIRQFFSPENVKNSFIINEILQPPISLRKRR